MIESASTDETFHLNKPILTGIDIPSRYCYLLSQVDHRDEDTWGIHLLDLQKQGFNPDRFSADDGSGLRAGHQLVFPNTPCDGDNFHIIYTMLELRRYFRNRLKSAVTNVETIGQKLGKAKHLDKIQAYQEQLHVAKANEKEMRHLSQSIDTLVSWMMHDVLNKEGPNPRVRSNLYDFIVEELIKLENLHPHRIQKVRVALQNQKLQLLAFVDVLNEKFKLIAKQFKCPLEKIWELCELQRCQHSSDTYAIRSLPLQDYFQDKFDVVEDAVLHALDTTERTSSMIENLHSRLKPYFLIRREIGYGYLDLLRFHMNHVPFLRAENPKLVDKTPTEALTKKSHKNWLALLGFTQFKKAA